MMLRLDPVIHWFISIKAMIQHMFNNAVEHYVLFNVVKYNLKMKKVTDQKSVVVSSYVFW